VNEFFKSKDWIKNYSLEEDSELTESYFASDIKRELQEIAEKNEMDYDDIIKITEIEEFEIKLFVEKDADMSGDIIYDYFNNTPKLYKIISKYGFEFLNDYNPNSKHSYF